MMSPNEPAESLKSGWIRYPSKATQIATISSTSSPVRVKHTAVRPSRKWSTEEPPLARANELSLTGQVRRRNGVCQVQFAGSSAAMPLRSMATAFKGTARSSATPRQGAVYGARKVEPSVAIRVGTRKLKERPSGRV